MSSRDLGISWMRKPYQLARSIARFTERDSEQKKKNAHTKPRGRVQEPLERIGRWFRAPSSAFFAALVAAAARGVAADTEVDASRETLQ